MNRHFTANNRAAVNQENTSHGKVHVFLLDTLYCNILFHSMTRNVIVDKSLFFYVFIYLYVLVERKQELDEALVNMVVKDLQSFSIVDSGFKNFVA